MDNPDTLRKASKKQGILLGNWYHGVIDPKGVDYEIVGYRRGSCPVAEEAARHVVNLPTRIPHYQAVRVVAAI